MKTVIHTENAPSPIGPYSQAILSNGTLYASGQIAIDPSNGEVFRGDISKQTEMVMKNVEAVLAAAKMTFSNVIKCSIFVTDMNDFAAVNAVYATYFQVEPPARETVQVAALPAAVNVEISVIAVA